MKVKFEMDVGQCPMCNSNNLEYGASEMVDDVVRYPYTCTSCGFVGAEDYSLTFAGHIAYKNEEGIQFLENPTTEKHPA